MKQIGRIDYRDEFITAAMKKIFPRTCHVALIIKCTKNENLDFSKKQFAVLKCCA